MANRCNNRIPFSTPNRRRTAEENRIALRKTLIDMTSDTLDRLFLDQERIEKTKAQLHYLKPLMDLLPNRDWGINLDESWELVNNLERELVILETTMDHELSTLDSKLDEIDDVCNSPGVHPRVQDMAAWN